MTLKEFCNKTLLSESKNSKCYLIGKNKDRVLKIFNNPLNKEASEKFKYFLKYSNESFLFPFELICDDKYFYGYITNKSSGKELEKIIYDINLYLLAQHTMKLENDIDYISKGKIEMRDITSTNILYDGNLLEVIDPDFYIIKKDKSIEEVKNYNRYSYKLFISDFFLEPYIDLGIKDKYIIDRINRYKKCDISTSDFIIKLKDTLENYYKEEVNKVNDISKILRR